MIKNKAVMNMAGMEYHRVLEIHISPTLVCTQLSPIMMISDDERVLADLQS